MGKSKGKRGKSAKQVFAGDPEQPAEDRTPTDVVCHRGMKTGDPDIAHLRAMVAAETEGYHSPSQMVTELLDVSGWVANRMLTV